MNSKNHTDPISRVFDLLPYIREKYNREIVFASRQNGKWETVSTTQYIEASNQVSFALLKYNRWQLTPQFLLLVPSA